MCVLRSLCLVDKRIDESVSGRSVIAASVIGSSMTVSIIWTPFENCYCGTGEANSVHCKTEDLQWWSLNCWSMSIESCGQFESKWKLVWGQLPIDGGFSRFEMIVLSMWFDDGLRYLLNWVCSDHERMRESTVAGDSVCARDRVQLRVLYRLVDCWRRLALSFSMTQFL
jgi:hypothetical protein